MVLSALRSGFQRVLSPVVDFLVRTGVSPNALTTIGTVGTIIGGGIYARGHIHLAGWVVGISALCDLLDGNVARRSGRSSVFGAFYDSTLDRIADGAVLGGLALFFARNGVHHAIPDYMSTPMVSVLLLGILGSFLTSYTRARAEGLGIEAHVGILQRPERIVLLSAPQAFFGLMFGGWLLMGICVLLTVTAWITVVQRVAFVYRATNGREATRQAGGSMPVTRVGEAEPRERVADGIAIASDRAVPGPDGLEPGLADVMAPVDGARRVDPGRVSRFDRTR